MTPHASRLALRALLLGSGLLLLSAGAASARGTHVNATINSDSAWVIPRVPAGTAGTSLRTRAPAEAARFATAVNRAIKR